jgi:hypothetical protein
VSDDLSKMTFYHIFNESPDIIIPKRRKKVLDQFQKAEFIYKGPEVKVNPLPILSDFELRKHNPEAKISSSSKLFSWMEAIRLGMNQSTFCFPDVVAGPDIVFALERNTSDDSLAIEDKMEIDDEETRNIQRIIVAVQVRFFILLFPAFKSTSIPSLISSTDHSAG